MPPAAGRVGRRVRRRSKLPPVVDGAFEQPKPQCARGGGVGRRCCPYRGALRGPARAMGQEAAPSATARSRWGLLASDDASEPTAASDRSGAVPEG